MKLDIFLNATYKSSCNMIKYTINCSYFNIKKDNIIIDNIGVFSELINSIEFYAGGYKSIIEYHADAGIKSTDIDYYNNDLKFKGDANAFNNFIKRIGV